MADDLYKLSWQQFRENVTANFRYERLLSESVIGLKNNILFIESTTFEYVYGIHSMDHNEDNDPQEDKNVAVFD